MYLVFSGVLQQKEGIGMVNKTYTELTVGNTFRSFPGNK
jgi:hypothetical protein